LQRVWQSHWTGGQGRYWVISLGAIYKEWAMEKKEHESKLSSLLRLLKSYGSLAVAYSGGVDSTFLVASAKKALGDGVLAITARSPIHPKDDLNFAKAMAQEIGVRHIVVDTEELDDPRFRENTKERCYHCKRHILQKIAKLAQEQGIRVIAHGITLDDLKDHRPGIKAAEEMGIVSPLAEAGFTKKELRAHMRNMGLVGWDKPPSPCLASRIPYGHEITLEKIGQVRKAERFLKSLGHRLVRVRNWDGLAVIELDPSRLKEPLDTNQRNAIVEELKKIGFKAVALDLEGYETGKLNRF